MIRPAASGAAARRLPDWTGPALLVLLIGLLAKGRTLHHGRRPGADDAGDRPARRAGGACARRHPCLGRYDADADGAPRRVAAVSPSSDTLLVVGYHTPRWQQAAVARARRALLPRALLVAALCALGPWPLLRPLEMRGTFVGGG